MRALGSAEQMLEVLEAALEAGINHIETAPSYGPAEAYLGQALFHISRRRPAERAELVLTSKILPGASFEDGQVQLRASLERLGVARLDNLAVHGLNRAEHLEWALGGPGAQLLEWALAQGLVAQLGFSSHGSTPLIERALASGRFSFFSLHLHLFWRHQAGVHKRHRQSAIGPAPHRDRTIAAPRGTRPIHGNNGDTTATPSGNCDASSRFNLPPHDPP
jgi:predicted aldo/keto reductase-like oxidoreductase